VTVHASGWRTLPSTKFHGTRDNLADEVISLEVTKDGQSFLPSTALPTSDTKGLDCFGDISDLSKLPNWATGTFHFKLTSPTDTVAEGDLTVK
jgi:hypothetical protein